MITRSNLAEQLREYQIRSKHDWASVSFFSSTSNLSSSRLGFVTFYLWYLSHLFLIQDPCCSLCHLGACDLTTPGIFSSILVLQAVATSLHPGLCQLTFAHLYENHEASET
ncbi:hypothetical protein Bca4012_038841 [Brassica carinata]